MGTFGSRLRRSGGRKGTKRSSADGGEAPGADANNAWATDNVNGPAATAAREERALAMLRQQLHMRPQDLVLDQLLLLMPLDVDREAMMAMAAAAVAGTYDEAAAEAASGARLGEDAKVTLGAQHRSALSPDALARAAALAVAFRTLHGGDKGSEAQLLPTRLYLVQYNVAVDEYAGASEDPRPYTRLPGGVLRYVLRTEATAKAGRVRLYTRVAATPRNSSSISSTITTPTPRRSAADAMDEEEADTAGAGTAAHALPGTSFAGSDRESTESPRSSDDKEPSAPPDTRAPWDPLPPAPSNTTKKKFGPSNPHDDVFTFTPSDRRPTGFLPPNRQNGTGRGILGGDMVFSNGIGRGGGIWQGGGRGGTRNVGWVAPPRSRLHPGGDSATTSTDASITHSNVTTPGTSRGSRETDSDYGYNYGFSSGYGRPGQGGHWPRPSAKYTPLRDGEIPLSCFISKDIPRSQIQESDDEEFNLGAVGGGVAGRGRVAATLFATRRYLRPKAYAIAMTPPQGLETPVACQVRVAVPQVAWPAQVEFAWVHRKRTADYDPNTKVPIQWPQPADVDKVRTLGCLLVPVERKNSLDWEYAFPRAEAFLESRLSGLQMRVMLAAAAMVRASAGRAALDDCEWAQWLRHVLFWQCERDVLGWVEERPGRALAALLEAFYSALTKRRLRCFFMPKYNLLADASSSHVSRIQERLSRVREAVLLHTLSMSRSLRALGVHATAPPSVNPHRLHLLLIADEDDLLGALNPALAVQPSPPKSKKAKESASGDESSNSSQSDNDDENDPVRQWNKKWMRQKQAEKAAKHLTVRRRASVDSIDLQKAVCHAPWDALRRGVILETLAQALQARARWAQSRGWLRHARVCARQASRLARLLEETEGAQRGEAANLREAAQAVEAECERARVEARRRDEIEVRKTSRLRSPGALSPGSPGAVMLGENSPNSTRFSFSTPLRVSIEGIESEETDLTTFAIAEEDEDIEAAGNEESRRYSTIAEVHAEMAALRAAAEHNDELEEQIVNEVNGQFTSPVSGQTNDSQNLSPILSKEQKKDGTRRTGNDDEKEEASVNAAARSPGPKSPSSRREEGRFAKLNGDIQPLKEDDEEEDDDEEEEDDDFDIKL